MSHAWTLETCPACDGAGMRYCEECEGICEHDRECVRCHGAEEVAVKAEGMALVGATFARVPLYRTKKQAEEARMS